MDKENNSAVSGFVKRLKDTMKEKQLKQRDVAKFAGVTEAAVSRWMTGKVGMPEASVLKRMAKNLDVSPFWLQFGEERRVTEGANKGVIPVGTFEINGETVEFTEARAPEFCAAANALRDCKSFAMTGNHMEPVIKDGDIIVIDTEEKTIKNGSIYAFFVNDQFIVAALSRSISGQISASYLNPQQTEHINGKITIIGRAVKRLTDL